MITIPIIDLTPAREGRHADPRLRAAAEVDAACRDTSFFTLTGHGVEPAIISYLQNSQHQHVGTRRSPRRWPPGPDRICQTQTPPQEPASRNQCHTLIGMGFWPTPAARTLTRKWPRGQHFCYPRALVDS